MQRKGGEPHGGYLNHHCRRTKCPLVVLQLYRDTFRGKGYKVALFTAGLILDKFRTTDVS